MTDSEALRALIRSGLEEGDRDGRRGEVDATSISELARRLFTFGAGSLLAAVAVWLVLATGVLRPSVLLLFAVSALTGGALLFVLVGMVVAAFVKYLPEGDTEPGEWSLFDPRRWVA